MKSILALNVFLLPTVLQYSLSVGPTTVTFPPAADAVHEVLFGKRLNRTAVTAAIERLETRVRRASIVG